MDIVNELVQFMQPDSRLDLKVVALTHVLSLTGSSDGIFALLSADELLESLCCLTLDQNQTVAKDAVLSLINLTAEEAGAIKVYKAAKQLHPVYSLIEIAVKHITDANNELADTWAMVLSNLTRVKSLIHEIIDKLEQHMLILAKVFAKLDYNKKNQKLHYLGPVFCNLTQISRGRELFCHSQNSLLEKLLPFVSYEKSIVRRGGIIGIFKNICFDPVYHDIVLNDNYNILHVLLYPLAGPEEFTDEENKKFPIELQYLPDIKMRENAPELRKMLLECLLQLCATKRCRVLLREKGVYEILREYHKWETKFGKDRNCILACENVVDILIKKEQEIGLDNYHGVDVPTEIAEKFVREDAEYLKQLIQ